MSAMNGVVTAIVIDTDDPEGEGRVQLRYPWIPGEIQSAWAPIAAPMSGGSRGFYFSPEVEDEVLVAFEHNDFDHPFVVGFLWNGVDRPPETDRNNRVFVSTAGHTIRFEDGDPKKLIIRSSSGHEILMDDSSGAGKVKIQSAGGLSITLDDAAQSLKLDGGGRSIEMTGSQILLG